jgi:hypothetical protein
MERFRAMHTSRLLTILALAAAAACGPGRPAPAPEQWVVLREDAEQRASVNVLGVRIEPGDLRRATVAVDYVAVRERDEARYDRELLEVQFDCGRRMVRTDGGSTYLGGEFTSVWAPGPNEVPWEKVPPGGFLDDAMKHVCRIAP